MTRTYDFGTVVYRRKSQPNPLVLPRIRHEETSIVPNYPQMISDVRILSYIVVTRRYWHQMDFSINLIAFRLCCANTFSNNCTIGLFIPQLIGFCTIDVRIRFGDLLKDSPQNSISHPMKWFLQFLMIQDIASRNKMILAPIGSLKIPGGILKISSQT